MLNLRLGMKIYDNEWFLRYRLSVEAVADILSEMGVTFVIAQSRFLPMQDSAVKSDIVNSQAADYARLDDVAFRRALAARNIGYIACLNICFDPVLSAKHPELLPIDQLGQPAQIQDWYIGMPPDRLKNLLHKIAMLDEAIPALSPDGVHLGFVRWPGFWETWLPNVERWSMPDYCYGPLTLRRFCEETGADVPLDDAPRAARVIAQRYRREWRDWKSGVTVEAINLIRAAVLKHRPHIPIAINTLPFFQTDFDNAVEEVFGQDISRLSDVVDVFEVMSYHQILCRDAEWPAAIGTDIKRRCNRKVICTLQAKALYLHGMHSVCSRNPQVSADEFIDAVDALEQSPVDGMCVFTFSDLLEARETSEGRKMLDRLRSFREGWKIQWI